MSDNNKVKMHPKGVPTLKDSNVRFCINQERLIGHGSQFLVEPLHAASDAANGVHGVSKSHSIVREIVSLT